MPLTRYSRLPRHAASAASLRAAAVPVALVVALAGAFAGLVTTSATQPAAAAGQAEKAEKTGKAGPITPDELAALAASRSTGTRASRDRAPVPPAPAAARPSDGALTSPYGRRWGRLHAGLDFATGAGSPVRAAAAGTVGSAGPESGYGTTVRLHHPDGAETVYAHLSATEVSVGQPVDVGQHLGREGSTGQSTGPHLHFEVRYGGAPVDPALWLLERGVTP